MAEDAFGIVGNVIGSAYHVESVVAEGGFGTVYRAHHGGFRAPVALKCLRLPPGLLPDGRQHFLEAFRAEAELLFRLSASIPNVVRPLHVDAFTAADGRFVPYIVLEWLDGHTLDALIRRRRDDGQAPLPLKKLVRLLTPVARALERAHHFAGPDGPVSIVHRDIKPENIFVAQVAGEQIVKILDFGIGKAKSMVSQVAGRASQGTAGIATFTPAYGSPEQWAPKRYGQTGPWTDVWGLALTLSEAVVGRPLIDGDAAAIMGTVLDPTRRPTPGGEGVTISDEVERVFAKALALDPRERYADAGAFWNELLAAARISSGEMQEVRKPRDSRAELDGGATIEKVERVELRRPSGRAPAAGATPSPAPPGWASGPAQPFVARAGLDAPVAASSPAPRGALQPLRSASSGSFEVPDLDLAPLSRPAAHRASSGLRAAVAPSTGLDDEPLELLVAGAALDLDLPHNDPLVRRASSGAMAAVRPSDPARPAPASLARPSSSSLQMPHTSLAPPGQPLAGRSDPPHSRRVASSMAPQPQPTAARPPFWSRFRIDLAPAPDASVSQRLLPGLLVLGAAVVVTILDQVYTAISGEVFTVASLRTSVVAGLVMLAGVVLCLYRLKRD
jgi:eukaryotic-like serine/threonine-protein kinase